MEDPGSPATKRRRIPKACGACRRSKVRCDEQRPCGRCSASSLECVYVERPPDPVAERFERLENAISGLQARLDQSRAPTPPPPPPPPAATQSANSTDSEHVRSGLVGPAGVSSFTLRERSRVDVVTAGLVPERDARAWFNTFFEGCDRFVPVFDRESDTFTSIRARSVILFDTLVAFASRASCGVLSRPWRQMYGLIRSRTSELVLKISSGESPWTMEDIQAVLVIASYSDSGAVLVDVALRAAMHAGLPTRLDRLFASLVNTESGNLPQTITEPTLFWTSRVWYGIFVLDSILSLDGGKPPSVVLHASSRRVRLLLSHPQRSSTDMRLFAQVELNHLRTASYDGLARATSASQSFTALQDVLTGAQVDLKLWLSEWQTIGDSDASLTDEHPVMLLNLRIQHVWATLTLHLRALTASGIENIALMDEGQRSIALAAKLAAEQHLQLLLTDVPIEGAPPIIPYVSSLKFAMEFVWAKNAFCVLIVLRLGILLGDPPAVLLQRLAEAKAFLSELAKVGMGANISYMRILAQTVDKCERAVEASLQVVQTRAGDSDFQSFIPKEFLFEWDFPGLNLCYIPLDWQDLFLDFGATA